MPIISTIEGNFSPIGRSRRPKNNATGGTVVDIPNYNSTGKKWRTHTFTSGTNSFTVLSGAESFRILAVGGGGGGSPGGGDIRSGYGGGGNGGSVVDSFYTINPSTVSVTVGGGAGHISAGPGTSSLNGNGGSSSSVGSLVSAGGGRGGVRNTGADSPTVNSNITGTNLSYGYGGCSNCCHTGQGRHSEGANGRGSGGGGQEQGQNTSETFGCQGGSGIVVIAYEID